MSTEVALQSPTPTGLDLQGKIAYARALAGSNMLPAHYRDKPENLLYAIEYADMLNVPPLVAVTGIHVIQGQPSASASLIASLVRRAGHKLRVERFEGGARATIIRADDPEFPHVVEFTMADAERAGLLAKNPNWKARPAVMCEWRAISACARLAASEVLFGVAYTPDELNESPRSQDGSYAITQAPARVTAAEIAAKRKPVELTAEQPVLDVEIVDPDEPEGWVEP